MKLRKLEILGFKSFRDRTVLDFPEGISGVVGPNGCGKSNIVDAIRWVLGEMRVTMLRGKKMEDVIFNGSEDAPPVGMAEVTMILEKGPHHFPGAYADCAEVMISRRLFRTGESEYSINNVPVRLLDVREFFMDTVWGPERTPWWNRGASRTWWRRSPRSGVPSSKRLRASPSTRAARNRPSVKWSRPAPT
jgi:chromosome segregation protein